jgi:hypothetical protein
VRLSYKFMNLQSTFDGTSKRRKAIVRTIEAFPTEASALKAAKALPIDANQQTPHSEGGPGTIAELVAHYRLKISPREPDRRLLAGFGLVF